MSKSTISIQNIIFKFRRGGEKAIYLLKELFFFKELFFNKGPYLCLGIYKKELYL